MCFRVSLAGTRRDPPGGDPGFLLPEFVATLRVAIPGSLSGPRHDPFGWCFRVPLPEPVATLRVVLPGFLSGTRGDFPGGFAGHLSGSFRPYSGWGRGPDSGPLNPVILSSVALLVTTSFL